MANILNNYMSRSNQYGSSASQSVFSDYKGQPLRSLVNHNTDDVNDIVNDYDWTYSLNRKRREEVPRVTIKEFKLAGNSYVASMISSALVFNQGSKDTATGINSIANKINEATPSPFGGFMGKLATGTAETVTNVVDYVADKASQSLVDLAVKQFGNSDKTANGWAAYTGNNEMKENYQYMYLRIPTNRKYIFPYYNDEFFNQSNSFQETLQAASYAEGAIQKAAEYADKFALAGNLNLLTEPGMYIERPKFYGFNGDGKEFTIDFYLYNTLTENEYIKNMHLLTKLITQNTPHRVNRILVDPPCLYELHFPGRGFYPYTHISNLDITHVGTRRYINGQIVPDAFKVTIKLKSLIMETNNITSSEMGTAGIDISKRYKYEDKREISESPKVERVGTENNPVVKNTGGSVTVNGKQIMSNSGFLRN